MANPYVKISDLTAFTMLDLLERFSQICGREVFKDLCSDIHCWKSESQGELGFSLVVPHPENKATKNPDQWRTFVDFVAEARETCGPAQRLGPDFKLLGPKFLITALLFKDPGDPKMEPERPLDRELLLILPGAKPDDVEINRLENGLTVTKTPYQFLFYQKPGQTPIAFFYLKWERSHRADPRTTLVSITGRKYSLLKGYAVGDLRLFAPEEVPLHTDKLVPFLKVVPYVGNFPDPRTIRKQVPYAAIWQAGDHKFEYFGDLAQMPWRRPVDLEPNRSHQYEIVVHDLSATADHVEQRHKPETVGRLRNKLGPLADEAGYYLQMVPAPRQTLSEKELERLRSKKAQIEYQLDYHEKSSKAKPVLRRFSQHHLLELADFLRSFPMEVLREGSLQYAFTANDHDPAGLHFFLYHPAKAYPDKIDLFRPRSTTDSRPTHFHLDPLWARGYYENDKDSWHRVFVPRGLMMYPPMHSWSKGEMNAYLRSVLEKWFDFSFETHKSLSSIKKPIYLFEPNHDEDKSDIEINISILDRDAFEPFHERLGFFNDNLQMVYQSSDVESFIREMATKMGRRRIEARIIESSEQAARAFEEAAQNTSRQMAQAFHGLLKVFSEEADQMNQQVRKLVEFFHQQDKRLRELQDLEKSMKILSGQLDKRDTSLSSEYKDLVQALKDITAKVNRYTDVDLSEAKTRMKQKIDKHVEGLNQTREDLSEKISELWRF